MTDEQVANFTYWVLESNIHRGAKSYSGKQRVGYIQEYLIPEFLRKYSTGKLTGWTEDIKCDNIEQQFVEAQIEDMDDGYPF